MDERILETLEAQTIMLCRIYDILCVIASAAEPTKAEAIMLVHEAGGLVNDEIILKGEPQ